MAQLMAAVAEERDKIGTEPPVDVEERAATFAGTIAETVVAEAGGRIVGMIHVEVSRYGYGVLGMLVDAEWRGRGVGSALVAGFHRPRERARPAQALPGRLAHQHRRARALPQVRVRRGGTAGEAVPAGER